MEEGEIRGSFFFPPPVFPFRFALSFNGYSTRKGSPRCKAENPRYKCQVRLSALPLEPPLSLSLSLSIASSGSVVPLRVSLSSPRVVSSLVALDGGCISSLTLFLSLPPPRPPASRFPNFPRQSRASCRIAVPFECTLTLRFPQL